MQSYSSIFKILSSCLVITLLLFTFPTFSAAKSIKTEEQKYLLAGQDLVIESISIQPVNPLPNQSFRISVVIRNIGTETIVDGFDAYLYIDPLDQPPTINTQDTSQVGWYIGLNPNDSFTWEVNHVFTASGCSHKIYAWVNRDNTVIESDITNNLKSRDLCVGYNITGRVTDTNGTPIPGAVIAAGAGLSAQTDSNGDYLLQGLSPGSYTLSTSKPSFTFAPLTRSISVPPNANGIDFIGSAVQASYSISGIIRGPNQVPLPDVTVTSGTNQATTDSSGTYTLTNLPAGNNLVTPSKAGYTFTPTFIQIVTPPDQTGQNFSAIPVSNQLKPWTFMLYLDGDTKDAVYGELYKAIQRLETSSNANVNVVAMLDGSATLDTFRITFDPQANYEPLGEKRMDDPATLIDFIRTTQRDFPAEHYYLAIADHANGIEGIAWDKTTDPKSALLTPDEIRQALLSATSNGAEPIDILHFDGCSFGLLDDALTTDETVKYVVLSQNLAWSVFLYQGYRSPITADTTPRQLAISVAQAYSTRLTSTNSQTQQPYTISVLDVSRLASTQAAWNAFADSLVNYVNGNAEGRSQLALIRDQSQKFESGVEPRLDITTDDIYIDLVDFATQVKIGIGSASVSSAAEDLLNILTGAEPLIIYEAHSSGTFNYFNELHTHNLDHARGISVYYPNTKNGNTYSAYKNGSIFTFFHNENRWVTFLDTALPPPNLGEPGIGDLGGLDPLLPNPYSLYLPILQR